jgi:uncharacterized membrane protein
MPSWDDYLSLAFDEIRQFGATSIQVMRRLAASLDGLSEVVTDPTRRAAVKRLRNHLEQAIHGSEFDKEDQEMAQQADRQGLGLTLISSKTD